MRFRIWLALLMFSLCAVTWGQQAFNEETAEQDLRHQTPEWRSLAPHLASLTTGSPQDLILAADVLRARRMPEDALVYYKAALRRGGDESSLLNREGITLLELRQPAEARTVLRRAVSLKAKDAQSWNNLGAAEYVTGNLRAAVQAYQHAIKLSKKTAVFHSNLGTAYFDLKDFESAQHQYDLAMTLDPNVFGKSGTGGLQAHMMSPADRGRFCFEMARLSARHHDDDGVMRWLAQASETGYDIHSEMQGDRSFDGYRGDVRVALLIKNAKAMRSGGDLALVGPVPTLPSLEK